MRPSLFRSTGIVASLALTFGVFGHLSQSAETGISGRTLNAEGDTLSATEVTLYLDDIAAPRRHYRPLSTVQTDDTGQFSFTSLNDGWYLVVVQKEGLAKSFRYVVLEQGMQLTQDFRLSKPVSSTIIVRDEQGQPIAGARLRTLDLRNENGEFWLRRREDWKFLTGSLSPSDQNGHLALPELAEGSVITATIDHPQFAPVRVENVEVTRNTTVEAVMKPGVRITLNIAGSNHSLPEAEIDLRHDPSSHPSTVIYQFLPFNKQGESSLTVEPGRYSLLRLTHDDYFILPEHSPRVSDGEYLQINAESNNAFHFHLRPKVKVRGRVIDVSTGQPLAERYVISEIPNHETGIEPAKRPPGTDHEWAAVDLAKTDRNGEYVLECAAGPVRIGFQDNGYIGVDSYLKVTVAANGSTVAPDLELRPIPKVTGKVVDAAGRSVRSAVVRLRGTLRWMQPVGTDEDGRFELAPSWVPTDPVTNERQTVQPLVAVHPHKRLFAHVEVDLADPASFENLTLTLAPHAPGALLDDFREELSAWERGESDKDRTAERAEQSLIGKPAPPLEGTWLNIEQPANGLDAFRGKYVLLDFWFIGCGPCHAEEPSLKLLHETYKDRGLVVVSVHDSSATAEAVLEYLSKHEVPYPVLVDHPDGRTIARYQGHGVEGYPSYLLIGPDGTIIEDDLVSPGPSLRLYKFELIRELILNRSSPTKESAS